MENVKLDVGCGSRKQEGWLGIDKRPCRGVDIVHDITVFPWPIPDGCCSKIFMFGVWGCIEPKYRLDVMNEMWRIAEEGCILRVEDQHVKSLMKYHDPNYYGGLCKKTFVYFDPNNSRYPMYEPKPWRVVDSGGDCESFIYVELEVIK